MTDRERFVATMHDQPRDRAPICDFGFWKETIEEWHRQGLPSWVQHRNYPESTNQYFGMDRWSGGPSANVDLCPAFEPQVLEDRGATELVRKATG